MTNRSNGMAESRDLSPSFLIGHVYYWGKAFIDNVFGLEKASRLDRTASCESTGQIRWTIHSDDPVTEMNPSALYRKCRDAIDVEVR